MHRRIALAACAAAGLLAAGCGSRLAGVQPGAAIGTAPAKTAPAKTEAAVPRIPGPHPDAAGRPPPAATAVGNRALAEQEAKRLLALAPVPPGAVPLAAAPPSLPGPAMGLPQVGSLVDQSRSWRVPLPFGQASSWLHAHAPRGLRSDGSMSSMNASGETAPTMVGVGYAAAASPAWQWAELDIGVAAAGPGASVLRADGVVIWLDPSLTLDDTPGPRARVTVAGGCPGSDTRYVGVTNPGATDLAHRLLPAASPTAGLECTYNGMNGRRWQLNGTTRLDEAAARRVARSLAGLPLAHADGGVTSCPMEDDSAQIVALSYPGRADVDLWVSLSGCGPSAANGYIIAG